MRRREVADGTKRDEAGRGPSRQRWFDVQVATENGNYVGRLRLPSGRSALQELMDDGRAYLGLWDARRQGTAGSSEYLVLHKAVIRSVTVCGAAVEEGA